MLFEADGELFGEKLQSSVCSRALEHRSRNEFKRQQNGFVSYMNFRMVYMIYSQMKEKGSCKTF